jgi:threonine dehydrogenase-like Zn-dependent dehydrogenase
MRAVTCTQARLELTDVPEPVPERGQALLRVARAGICGSDLHARHHADELAEVTAEAGYDAAMRADQTVVLGHEFSGEIIDYGPSSRRRLKPGTPVVAMPLLRRGKHVHPTGLSAQAPGAFAEQVLVQESLTFPVPNGLSLEHAALTEPMAVGLHAVRRGQVGRRRVAVVIGCGPVGLAVICMLKAHGVRTVIASDLSPARRALARTCGADVVVDPAVEQPFASAADHGHLTQASQLLDLAVDGMDKLTRLPHWWRAYRAAEKVGAAQPRSPVVFECVGVPGIIDQIITTAPLASRVVVVGVCMSPDSFRPAMAINKEIDLRFVIGYTPLDFRDALHLLADGKVDPAPLITGQVGLPGVDAAFTALSNLNLGNPEQHAKILVDPASSVALPG